MFQSNDSQAVLRPTVSWITLDTSAQYSRDHLCTPTYTQHHRTPTLHPTSSHTHPTPNICHLLLEQPQPQPQPQTIPYAFQEASVCTCTCKQPQPSLARIYFFSFFLSPSSVGPSRCLSGPGCLPAQLSTFRPTCSSHLIVNTLKKKVTQFLTDTAVIGVRIFDFVSEDLVAKLLLLLKPVHFI